MSDPSELTEDESRRYFREFDEQGYDVIKAMLLQGRYSEAQREAASRYVQKHDKKRAVNWAKISKILEKWLHSVPFGLTKS